MQQRLVFVHVDAALLVHLELVDDVALFFQPFAQGQDGRMLDVGGDYRVAFRLGLYRREDGGRVGLGAAGGKDDFRVMLGAEQRLNLTAGLLQRLADFTAEGVNRRGVAEMLREERQHRFDHSGIDPRRGVVVQVNRFRFHGAVLGFSVEVGMISNLAVFSG